MFLDHLPLPFYTARTLPGWFNKLTNRAPYKVIPLKEKVQLGSHPLPSLTVGKGVLVSHHSLPLHEPNPGKVNDNQH